MNQDIQNSISSIIDQFCKSLNIEYSIEINKEGSQYRVNVTTPDNLLFEENNYEFLYILQYFVRVGVHRQYPQDFTHFLIDINNKRFAREKVVKDFIPDIVVKQVLELGNTIILIGLNGYERKLLHNHFYNLKGVSTKSLGDPDSRKFMITPNSEVGVSGIENAKIYDIAKLVKDQESKTA
jgi:predicted RNA-binding protein Jag